MPSSTFLNLPAEKQEKLLEAATREFSHRPFNEASINQIIKEAGIPRGSFYMYFQDKEDLFRYLLKGYVDQLFMLLEAMAAERDDLDRYVDLFGYSPKYGVSGRRIASVEYRPQPYQRVRPLYEVTETL